METPTRRSRGRVTPGSTRLRSTVKTPKSVLTPNDDAAEKASVRRKRRSEALRLSLSDTFAVHADQHGQQQQQQAGAGSSKPVLSEQARNALLEQCLKLATENKITDGNAWHLDLIQHLPDIVSSGPGRGQGSSSGYNFQKMSGGLDAGVTIYARRVELTYKSAFSLGMGPGKQQGGDGEDGYEADEDGDDAAAAAAKAQKKGKARQGGSADEEATLTTPDHLRAKKGDNTFAVDPLFHTMSALFDEGGAKGLLLLNRSVYDSAHIMTNAQDVPEQQFPLQPQPRQDTLLELRPLQQQLAACSSSASQSGTAVLTPGLHQLYTVLEDTRKALPGQRQQQTQPAGGVDVASIMQQALRGLPPTPMPKRVKMTHAAGTGAAGAQDPGAAAGADADADMADAGNSPDLYDVAADGTDMQYDDSSSRGGDCGDEAAADGPVSGSIPVVASFLASCEAAAAEEEDAAAADADGYGREYGGYEDDDGHPGYGDDGDSGWGQQQQQQSDRRQSLLGLGAGQEHEESSGLEAEALEQLLGAAAGGAGKGGTTAGTGWAGSRFWKYRSAAAAAARMAAGSSGGGPVKRAAAALSSASKSRSVGPTRIDFTARPTDLSSALAPGDPKKTRLVTAPSSSTADTLLPEDLHYQASNLLQLFLRPSPISFTRQQQRGSSGPGGGGDQMSAWAEEGDGDEGGWGDDDGYGDDGDEYGSGADGYNAGDLSVGDPGFSGYDAASGGAAAGGNHWWSADGELLSAPKRMTGGHVRYQRSAKQVDVRALKDLLWDSLVTVNSDKQTNGSADDSSAPDAAAAAAAPAIPFQDVIVAVPSDSAAGALEDVSVHMCFICLLHLANEKGLVVRAQEDLTTLTISNVQQQPQQEH